VETVVLHRRGGVHKLPQTTSSRWGGNAPEGEFIFHIAGETDRFAAETRQRFQRALDTARLAPDLDVPGLYAEISAELEVAIKIMHQ